MRQRQAEWPAVNAASNDATLFSAAPSFERSALISEPGSKLKAYSSKLPYESQRDSSAKHRRFRGQCGRILERLQRGPATNRELAEISLKYTGRISDLRAAGYVIECEERDDGVSVYSLSG